MRPIRVLLWCNDQHGRFEACVRRVEFEQALTIEATALDKPPRITFGKFGSLTRLLRISGKVFPVLTYAHSAPLLSFDCVTMEPAVAAELMNFLKSTGAFQSDAGFSSVFESWQAEGVQFSARELEAACAA